MMSVICSAIVFLVIQRTISSSVPMGTTVGDYFVIAFPHVMGKVPQFSADEIYISSEKEEVVVVISEPKDINADDALKTPLNRTLYKLKSFDSVRHRVREQAQSTQYFIDSQFWSVRIDSNGPIKVFAFIGNALKETANVYIAMPESSCYDLYHVTNVGIDNLLLMVFSFHQQTKVTIKYLPSFGTINIRLNPYRRWYQYAPYKQKDAGEWAVMADKPVFILAGNALCKRYTNYTDSDRDLCLANMKPVATWGKEYFIPRWYDVGDYNAQLRLRFNAEKWPLYLKIHCGPSLEDVIIENHSQSYNHGDHVEPIVVTANIPFALYARIPEFHKGGNRDLQMINVIPSEQWKTGAIYVKNKLEDYTDALSFHFILRTKELLKEGTEWKFVTKVNSWNYYTNHIDMRQMPAGHFHIIGSMKPAILYIRGTPTDQNRRFITAYDYHQGVINYAHCKKTANANLSDGVDNDCDGIIDEEIENGQDDDGDGLTDEDTAQQFYGNESGLWKADFGLEKEVVNENNFNTYENEGISYENPDLDGSSDSNKLVGATDRRKVNYVYVFIPCFVACVISVLLVLAWYNRFYKRKPSDLADVDNV